MRMLLKPCVLTLLMSAWVMRGLPQDVSSEPVESNELPRFQPGCIAATVAIALPGGLPVTSKFRKSTFGRPLDVVGLNRIVLLPAFTETVRVLVTQVVHNPVPSNDAVCTVAPLTMTSAGRLVVVPLAKRTPSVAVPANEEFTVNCAAAPTALLPLQNPLPEKPAWLESIVPLQVAGAVSAS